HPVHGPVNLYSARFASFKQRILAAAENLVCPWPECNVPADSCQVHHLHPHNLGGQTSPENLTMLCKYHNGAKDEHPNAPPHNGLIRCRRCKFRSRSPDVLELDDLHLNSSLGALSLL